MRGLAEKIVIVTGGGNGIGRATCRRFAEAGASVAVLDIDGAAAERVASAITGAGGRAQALACDITDHEAAVDAVRAVEAAHGRVDVLVNNAVCPGATNTALFAEYKKGAGNPEKLEEAFRRAIPMGRIGEPEDVPGAIL